MKYMKQLDSLRAFAVLFVLFSHFYGCKTPPFLPFFKNSIAWGGIGVCFFFVLSGYLITGILLKNRGDIDRGNASLSNSIKVFFVRRSLRIFPIYFFAIAVTYALDIAPVRETVWWLVSYTSNFLMAQRGDFYGSIGHLWSLSVEEQFYLIWPWIILLTPRKHLLTVIFSIIVSALVFRHLCSIFNVPYISVYMLTPGNMDYFGIGAISAYIRYYNIKNDAVTRFYSCSFWIGSIYFGQSLVLKLFGLPDSLSSLSSIFSGLLYGWIIVRAADGFDGIIGYVLDSRPLVYIGKISYGIYLYHYFIPEIIRKHIPTGYILLGRISIIAQFFVLTALTILISSISWVVLEKGILSLKDRQKAFPVKASLAHE